jgi:hypothetical protein
MSETYFVKQHKKDNYTILDNTCIRDCNLSWKAKGVHTYLMSLPDDWKIHISEIVNHSCDGKAALYSAIQMLEKYGYIKKIRNRRKDGCFDNTVYQVFEKAELDVEVHPHSDFPDVENPDMDNPVLDNRTLLTTNILNTNKLKTELTNYDKNKVSETVFVKKIRELFEGEYPFDSNFESAVVSFIHNNELKDDRLENYLGYVFERTNLCNVKKSFEGLFRKLALSKSILIDFKKSIVLQNNEKLENEKDLKPVLKIITCPICNIEFDVFKFYCPNCNLTFKAIEDNNEIEINIARALSNLNDEERQKLDVAMDKKLKSIGRLFFIKNEKEEFYREYGLIN